MARTRTPFLSRHLLLVAAATGAACLGGAPLTAASVDAAGTIAAHHVDGPLIQVALLLDDSGSMDGLINQARAQLWELVGLLGKSTRHGVKPRIEVALYHYGDVPFLSEPVVSLTNDLDQVSERLFTIRGGGGTEACGQVIHQAISQLAWRQGGDTLRLIVIAGNEPFTQGSYDFRSAVGEARRAGVVVHTIHCGPRQDGVEGKWEEAASLGGGTFTCIDQNAAVSMAAPQDPDIHALNQKLNATYVAYGAQGAVMCERQCAQDANAAKVGSLASRAATKAGAAYTNSEWDLVDAVRDQKVDLASPSVPLPAELQNKTVAEREALIAAKAAERSEIQAKIAKLSVAREAWVKSQQPAGAATLGDGLRAAVLAQATAAGFALAP